jgi:23S rRNA (cytidine1920-2'-O)/16S rRNA (cytidine1409-2'-O)-methyltransferase
MWPPGGRVVPEGGVVKRRADLILVERGLFESRAKAQAAIAAGLVTAAGIRVARPSDTLAEDAEIVASAPHPYVSRGGVKLAGALDALAVDVEGIVAADFGASTGGFTDCLLQRGALRVYAIDVGYGQLHEKLRADPRVVVMERTNARHLVGSDLPEPVALVVIDASFIGLEKLLPAAKELAPGGAIVAMVKPQFEVGPRGTKRGVVTDPALRASAIESVAAAAQALGLEEVGRCDSTLAGPDGNLEAFLHLRVPTSNGPASSDPAT